MNILIVTASVGSGHEKAAAAISQGFAEYFPDANINTVDFMAAEVSPIHYFTKKCYLAMLNMVPSLYECMYNFTASPKKGGAIQAMAAAAMANTMKKLIRKYNPQLIFCTHPFPTEAVAHLSRKWRSRFLSAALITDYSVHQMWVCQNIDLYFVAHSDMIRALAAYGIHNATDSGIPVDKKFREQADKATIKNEFNLDDTDPVLLMMGGGLGLGGMEEAMSQLEMVNTTLQILVIAGRNQELLSRIQENAKNSKHRITVFGYTDRVRDLMEAADLLISKPGGITLTEAMTVGLPMLLHQPIPGPESDNARYMSDHGIARWLHSDEPLSEAVTELVNNPQALIKMHEAAGRHARPQAVQRMADKIKARLKK